MIKCTVSTNSGVSFDMYPADTTLRQVLDAQNVNYGTRMIIVDGSTVQPGQLDKTFEQLGITSSCYITAIDQKNNA